MFIELEDRIVKILKEKIKEVPSSNITLDGKPSGQPAIWISSTVFKIRRAELAEGEEGGEMEEVFSGDGANSSFRLKEKPTSIIAIESPPGKRMREMDDYTVDYDEGLVTFRNPPPKGTNNIALKYLSAKKKSTVVRMRLRAKYYINIMAKDRRQADGIAESVIKSLVESESELAGIAEAFKPIKGRHIAENQVSLTYLAELELKLEKLIPPIEKIEIRERREPLP